MTHLAAILTCLALAGCGTALSQTQTVDLGAEVTLSPGETTSVNSTEFKVRFVAVTEDSRCPRDVTCIWAGEVKIQFEIHESAKSTSPVEILEGGNSVVGAYRVTLVRVEPATRSTARIAPQDYRATIVVEKTA